MDLSFCCCLRVACCLVNALCFLRFAYFGHCLDFVFCVCVWSVICIVSFAFCLRFIHSFLYWAVIFLFFMFTLASSLCDLFCFFCQLQTQIQEEVQRTQSQRQTCNIRPCQNRATSTAPGKEADITTLPRKKNDSGTLNGAKRTTNRRVMEKEKQFQRKDVNCSPRAQQRAETITIPCGSGETVPPQTSEGQRTLSLKKSRLLRSGFLCSLLWTYLRGNHNI